MTPIVFTDLDDTLFQTARKMSFRPEIKVSHAENGSHSFMMESQQVMFEWLNKTTCLIPVTARSTSALARCSLSFKSYQVASNGATILKPGGDVDLNWKARTDMISDKYKAELHDLNNMVHHSFNASGKFRHWIVRENEKPIYFCVKSNGDSSWLDDIEQSMKDDKYSGLLMHRNGNNLSMTPKLISKKVAVDYLKDALPSSGVPIWGMGDSMTDLPFMESCQMMVIPTGSQVHNHLQEKK